MRIEALLQEYLDWGFLLQKAALNGLMPLLYWSLNSTCPEAVPTAALNRLRDHFHINTRRNLFLRSELLEILSLFETYGIRAIPYKGPVLAETIYANLALRQSGDLDILVHKRDVSRAKDLLISEGYQLISHTTGAEEATSLHPRGGEYNYNVKLLRPAGKVKLELHWGISFFLPLDAEQLWLRSEPISLTGATVLGFPPEDLLLVLCVHGSKHLWERLMWICDIAELCRVHQQIDWGRAIDRIGRLGGERMLSLGLLLSHEIFGAALPEDALQKITHHPAVEALVEQSSSRLLRDTDTPPGDIDRYLFYFKMRERYRDKVRYFIHIAERRMVPTSRDREFFRLPERFAFLYYFLRPFRLAREYGPVLVRRFLSGS